MLKESVTIDETIDYLNSLFEIDPVGMGAILLLSVPCDETTNIHPVMVASGYWSATEISTWQIICGIFRRADSDGDTMFLTYKDATHERRSNMKVSCGESVSKDVVSIDEVVQYLNDLIMTNPLMMRAALTCLIECDYGLEMNHLARPALDLKDFSAIGLMGVINGMFGSCDSWGQRAMAYTMRRDPSESRVFRPRFPKNNENA